MAKKSAALLLLALAGCSKSQPGLDLLAAKECITTADIAGRDATWLKRQAGKLLRIGDVVRRVLPATPPSRIVYGVDIPTGAHLAFACAVDPRLQGHLAVEFVVKIRRGGREQTAWTQLIDPARRPGHRGFVPADVDLSAYAGSGAEIVLETRSAEKPDDPRAAAWASPVLTSAYAAAPLAIIYLVDTLRADHTTAYGYERDTTPELLRFANEAMLFDAAIVHASWTKPSVASLLTSVLPARHGAVHLRDPFAERNLTLAEMLQAKGFTTGAFTANSVIYERGTGFEQGFDVFQGIHDQDGQPSNRAVARDVVDAALAWLDAHRGLPAFLLVHTMDPHIPYSAPAPFDTRFPPHPTPEHPGQKPHDEATRNKADRDYYVARYDGEIAYGDAEFGRFVRELKARGLYDRALVVFLSDHGEEFGEHDNWGHGTSLFDELVRIPLLVKFPGGTGAGRRVKEQVQEVDVLPTVLQVAGLPVPGAPDIEGRPLQAALAGTLPPRPAVMEISHRAFVAHGIRTDREKYVRRFSPESDELYFDLGRDPGETHNRVEESRERVRTLRAGVEPSLLPNPFRNTLLLTTPGAWRLTVRTTGWIEDVATTGMGSNETVYLTENRGELHVTARPEPRRPREVSFVVRPRGTRVFVEAKLNGRALRREHIFLGEEGVHPQRVTDPLPDLDAGAGFKPFAPRDTKRPGLYAWLALAPGREIMDLDKDAQERLRALGYVGAGQ